MSKSCPVCRKKPKIRCDKCRNDFCLDHAVKCVSCGTITCIRDLGKSRKCPVCMHTLDICPECLLNGKIVRNIPGTPICPECGYSA